MIGTPSIQCCEGSQHRSLTFLELDLRFDYVEERFEVYHLPVIDEETTCRLFTECLERIESWSATHRRRCITPTT